MNIDLIAKTVQVLSVVAGVVISVISFNATRDKEAETRKFEAARPFLELRQKLYMEAVKTSGILANPEVHNEDELRAAKKRFRELYVAELSMVESKEVEGQMMALAGRLDPSLLNFNPAQKAAYDLAHALRDSFTEAWGLRPK